MSTFVIAEIGPNHNGSLDRAIEMIRLLAGSGADAIKFQLAQPEAVYSADAFKAAYQAKNDGEGSVIEMSRRLQLPREAHVVLYQECRRIGIPYMCTAFDLGSLRFLDETFDLPGFKVGSGEMLTLDMLRYMATRRRRVYLSTGMATLDEIDAALNVLTAQGLDDVTLMHCVSNYPAPHADINLRVMNSLAARFDRPVGFSDHSIGPECCLAAVAMGATVVEKHITLDKNLPGPDHKASATIEEFTAMVAAIRKIEAALGRAEKVFSQTENDIRRMARKSLVTVRDLPEGHILTEADLCFKRPGTGLSPMELPHVTGRRLARPVQADRVIRVEDLV